MSDSVNSTSGGPDRGRRICIVGGGIGGLTAALAFAQRSFDVDVHEQAPALTEVGAGIQITPNGARVLDALGLGAALEGAGIRGQAVEPMDALTGRRVTRFDLSQLDGPPYRFLHRADLIAILADACGAAGVSIHLGSKVDAADMDADLVVGAEGIHSPTRTVLNGTEDPFFTGQVAWRAIVDAPDADPVARIWMAPRRHIVTYPLTGGRMNIVAVQERQQWAGEGWNHTDDAGNLRQAFRDVGAPLSGLLQQVDTVHLWGLFRHPVAQVWAKDRLCILGDAAHPTLPFLAQGANLAIEDAWVLAACCEHDLDAGLVQYQAERQPRVKRAIAAANANARKYHLSGIARTVAHTGLKTIGYVAPNAFLERMDWLYGLDVTE
ncbi:FAD-dependent monooxygenase [Octadecabacter sp. G9-8]|uniref:FAD-dependent monooxygenase n=1 Tax=Octadecabacter dasysiphoniae TaxID=2909341 RepID=A0ABS9D1K8_9RHOB|nr:FAD-dependent monooxygenase [Octadecabacter dasysiphoniae]MCF2872281.1 FAD-dependent monooxygenase [Octadecabacter dasysiphoniae]